MSSRNSESEGDKAGNTDRRQRESLRVVIADDDRDAVLVLSSLFRDQGHETTCVYRGDEVVDAILQFAADVALVDLVMPGMTGLDVAREIRRRYGAAAPVLIAVTGWNTSSDSILSRAAGFDEHVGKPYNPNELISLVERRARERTVRRAGLGMNQAFGGAPDTLHTRLLRQLAEILGGTEAVRRALMVPTSDMSRWIAGVEKMPPAIFIRATDLLLNSTPVPDVPPGPMPSRDGTGVPDEDASNEGGSGIE